MGPWSITWALSPITLKVMDDLGRPQERYPKSFMLISSLEVCQECGVKKGGGLKEVDGS